MLKIPSLSNKKFKKNFSHNFLFSLVSFVIEAAIAANATASAGKSDGKSVVETEKNKRQVNQYLRTPGSSAATSLGTEPEPQAFPLQLSHGIYSQQRVPLYTRRPTSISKPQVTEDVDEQELQPQQQVRCDFYFCF